MPAEDANPHDTAPRPAPKATAGAISLTVRFEPCEADEIDQWLLDLRTESGIRWDKAEVVRELLRVAHTADSILRHALTARAHAVSQPLRRGRELTARDPESYRLGVPRCVICSRMFNDELRLGLRPFDARLCEGSACPGTLDRAVARGHALSSSREARRGTTSASA